MPAGQGHPTPGGLVRAEENGADVIGWPGGDELTRVFLVPGGEVDRDPLDLQDPAPYDSGTNWMVPVWMP